MSGNGSMQTAVYQERVLDRDPCQCLISGLRVIERTLSLPLSKKKKKNARSVVLKQPIFSLVHIWTKYIALS